MAHLTSAAGGQPPPGDPADPADPAVHVDALLPIRRLQASGAWPSFSPDGRTIVFSASLRGERRRLFVVPAGAAGSEPEALTPADFDASRPSWSWNPASIAFCQDNRTIWTLGADGSGLAPYLPEHRDPGLNLLHPCWYRDLTSIAAVGHREGPAGREGAIYRLTPGAPDPVQALTRFPEVCAGRPGVSPDGATVAFSGNAGRCNQEGNQVWRVTPPQPPRRLERGPIAACQGRSPSWSPDGRWIAFVSTRPAPLPGKDTPKALWIAAASGEAVRQVTDSAFNPGQAEWSRDQTRIVVGSFTHGIGVIDVPERFLPARPPA
jgi:Tol biopolymer transport system component